MRKIVVAKSAGFCFGVKKAVNTAIQNAGQNCYILGDIIHNKTVIDDLHKRGIKTISSIDELPKSAENVKVIIRSHGASPETYRILREAGVEVIDATCPFVAKIHDIVRKHYEDGYHIVIIGEKTHPEVVATNGWCDNTATVIEDEFDLDAVSGYDKLCFVCQTTFDGEKFKKLSEKIHKKYLKTVEIFDTICYTTYERQEEAKKLASECSSILIVGDKSSSNTTKLYELCKSVNYRTYFVHTADDLENINFPDGGTIGIVAGASTPTESSMEVNS